jgi:hypothetical protein
MVFPVNVLAWRLIMALVRRPRAERSRGSAIRRLAFGVLTAHGSLLTVHALVAQTPGTSLTVYNDGRVLVRRVLPLELRKGESEQRIAIGPVDPGSLFPLDSGVTIVASTYDGATDQQSVLRRSLGRRLTFRSGRDTITAEVVGVDPERFRMPDGTITFDRPGTPQFPADLVVLDPVLTLALSSAENRKDLRLGYFTDGGGWSARYQVILGRESARVMGHAVVTGGALRLKEVELQLLAGQVSAVALKDESRLRRQAMMVAQAREDAGPAEEKIGEFHLYTLPGRATLEPGVVTTVALFPPTTARIRKTFEVRGRIPYWGGLPQYGDEEDLPVTVTYTIDRPRKSELGDRPLPAGVVRLFEPDSARRLQLIGEGATDHAPAGEDLRVPAGAAFDLTAKRVQTAYSTRRDSTASGWRTLATADYRVTLTNAGGESVTVEVVEARGGEWSILSSSVKPVKKSSTRTVFPVPVPANGRARLTYRVRVVW